MNSHHSPKTFFYVLLILVFSKCDLLFANPKTSEGTFIPFFKTKYKNREIAEDSFSTSPYAIAVADGLGGTTFNSRFISEYLTNGFIDYFLSEENRKLFKNEDNKIIQSKLSEIFASKITSYRNKLKENVENWKEKVKSPIQINLDTFEASTTFVAVVLDQNGPKTHLNIIQKGDSLCMVFRLSPSDENPDSFYYKPIYVSKEMQYKFNAPFNFSPNDENHKHEIFVDKFQVVESDVVIAASDGVWDNIQISLLTFMLNYIVDANQADISDEIIISELSKLTTLIQIKPDTFSYILLKTPEIASLKTVNNLQADITLKIKEPMDVQTDVPKKEKNGFLQKMFGCFVTKKHKENIKQDKQINELVKKDNLEHYLTEENYPKKLLAASKPSKYQPVLDFRKRLNPYSEPDKKLEERPEINDRSLDNKIEMASSNKIEENSGKTQTEQIKEQKLKRQELEPNPFFPQSLKFFQDKANIEFPSQIVYPENLKVDNLLVPKISEINPESKNSFIAENKKDSKRDFLNLIPKESSFKKIENISKPNQVLEEKIKKNQVLEELRDVPDKNEESDIQPKTNVFESRVKNFASIFDKCSVYEKMVGNEFTGFSDLILSKQIQENFSENFNFKKSEIFVFIKKFNGKRLSNIFAKVAHKFSECKFCLTPFRVNEYKSESFFKTVGGKKDDITVAMSIVLNFEQPTAKHFEDIKNELANKLEIVNLEFQKQVGQFLDSY